MAYQWPSANYNFSNPECDSQYNFNPADINSTSSWYQSQSSVPFPDYQNYQSPYPNTALPPPITHSPYTSGINQWSFSTETPLKQTDSYSYFGFAPLVTTDNILKPPVDIRKVNDDEQTSQDKEDKVRKSRRNHDAKERSHQGKEEKEKRSEDVEENKERKYQRHQRRLSKERDKALENLWKTHLKERAKIQENPKSHKDYDKEKMMWNEFMVSKGFDLSSKVVHEEWKLFWRKTLEEILQNEWEQKKEHCIAKFQLKKRSESSESSSSSSSARSSSKEKKKLNKRKGESKENSQSEHANIKKSSKSINHYQMIRHSHKSSREPELVGKSNHKIEREAKESESQPYTKERKEKSIHKSAQSYKKIDDVLHKYEKDKKSASNTCHKSDSKKKESDVLKCKESRVSNHTSEKDKEFGKKRSSQSDQKKIMVKGADKHLESKLHHHSSKKDEETAKNGRSKSYKTVKTVMDEPNVQESKVRTNSLEEDMKSIENTNKSEKNTTNVVRDNVSKPASTKFIKEPNTKINEKVDLRISNKIIEVTKMDKKKDCSNTQNSLSKIKLISHDKHDVNLSVVHEKERSEQLKNEQIKKEDNFMLPVQITKTPCPLSQNKDNSMIYNKKSLELDSHKADETIGNIENADFQPMVRKNIKIILKGDKLSELSQKQPHSKDGYSNKETVFSNKVNLVVNDGSYETVTNYVSAGKTQPSNFSGTPWQKPTLVSDRLSKSYMRSLYESQIKKNHTTKDVAHELPVASSTQPAHTPSTRYDREALELVGLFQSLSNNFGVLSKPISLLYDKFDEYLRKGVPLIDCFDEDALALLDMISNKLVNFLKAPDISLVQSNIYQEAYRGLAELLKNVDQAKLNESKKRSAFLHGLDLKKIAVATDGKDCTETIEFIKISLIYQNLPELSSDKLMEVYLAVRSVQASNLSSRKPVELVMPESSEASLSNNSPDLGTESLSKVPDYLELTTDCASNQLFISKYVPIKSSLLDNKQNISPKLSTSNQNHFGSSSNDEFRFFLGASNSSNMKAKHSGNSSLSSQNNSFKTKYQDLSRSPSPNQKKSLKTRFRNSSRSPSSDKKIASNSKRHHASRYPSSDPKISVPTKRSYSARSPLPKQEMSSKRIYHYSSRSPDHNRPSTLKQNSSYSSPSANTKSTSNKYSSKDEHYYSPESPTSPDDKKHISSVIKPNKKSSSKSSSSPVSKDNKSSSHNDDRSQINSESPKRENKSGFTLNIAKVKSAALPKINIFGDVDDDETENDESQKLNKNYQFALGKRAPVETFLKNVSSTEEKCIRELYKKIPFMAISEKVKYYINFNSYSDNIKKLLISHADEVTSVDPNLGESMKYQIANLSYKKNRHSSA